MDMSLVGAQLNRDFNRKLNLLSIESNREIRDMIAEALNDFFKKNNVSVVENPHPFIEIKKKKEKEEYNFKENDPKSFEYQFEVFKKYYQNGYSPTKSGLVDMNDGDITTLANLDKFLRYVKENGGVYYYSRLFTHLYWIYEEIREIELRNIKFIENEFVSKIEDNEDCEREFKKLVKTFETDNQNYETHFNDFLENYTTFKFVEYFKKLNDKNKLYKDFIECYDCYYFNTVLNEYSEKYKEKFKQILKKSVKRNRCFL